MAQDNVLSQNNYAKVLLAGAQFFIIIERFKLPALMNRGEPVTWLTYPHVEDGDHSQRDEEVHHSGGSHQVQGSLSRDTPYANGRAVSWNYLNSSFF